METDPFSETLFSSYLEFRTKDEGHQPSDSEECSLLGYDGVWLGRTDVSEDHHACIIRMERINDYEQLFTPMMEVLYSTEMSVLTRATRRHVPEDGILLGRHRENLRSLKRF
jgi:hypothetical protein